MADPRLRKGLARLRARVEPRLAFLAGSKGRWLPLLAAALVLAVVGVALLTAAPNSGQNQPSVDIDVISAQPDTRLAQLDTDKDGLSDLEELVSGTDPKANDTDGDAMPDLWEVRHAKLDVLSSTYCPDPLVTDANRDCDHDGLSNAAEMAADTDPSNPDIDGDGVLDGLEVACGSDPFTPDSGADPDADGLSNLQEQQLGTRCDRADSDLDGLTDPEEFNSTRTDPTRRSTGGSGIADGWLVTFHLPLDDAGVGFQDADHDGLTALEESRFSEDRVVKPAGLRCNCSVQGKELLGLFGRGLTPAGNDTDGDGMPDGYEVRDGLDPLDPGPGDPRLGPNADPDADGLSNLQESKVGSNPFLTDSDGDALSDKQEVDGYDATIAGKATHVTSDPGRADTDGDGLSDLEEKEGKALRNGVAFNFPALDPRNPDTDLDGLGDFEEVSFPCASASDPRRLDATNPDSDADGILDGAEVLYWQGRHDATGAQQDAALEELAKEMGNRAGSGVGREQALSAMAPCGDLDADGKPNLLDRDSDGDTLDDGRELEPDTKATSADSRIERPLPSTDPALGDSDADKLPDAWEDQFGDYDFGLGDWNLNASSKDSLRLRDGRTDADRDLDRDGVHYNASAYAIRVAFGFTNYQEFLAGTSPNVADTDADGLADGWEAYFTCITATVPKKLCGGIGRSDKAEVEVDLDPSSPDADKDGVSDGNETGKSVPFARFVAVSDSNQARGLLDGNRSERFADCPNTGPADPDCDIYPGVVRIHGLWNLTFLQEFTKDLDPSLQDTDGDGLPDAWEAAYTLDPLEAGDARGDLDNDGLPNLDEFTKGSEPTVQDSDAGGLTDGKDPNPAYPPDDAPNGDTDCDGVLNKDEQARGTSLADPDSDRDGLLDGPGVAFYETVQSGVVLARDVTTRQGCTLSAAQLSQRFVDAGIAANVTSRGVLFLGEDMFGTTPTLLDSDGDGLPDGWESYWVDKHGIEGARDPLDAGSIGDGSGPGCPPVCTDALNTTAEYATGMPRGWDVAVCGPWWLGNDPRSTDTDGDGVLDGTFDRTGGVLGADVDLDNDGLNDFTGEDPSPLADHNNTSPPPLTDCLAYHRFVDGWVFHDARRGTVNVDSTGSGVPDRLNYAPTRLVGLSADLDPDGRLPAAQRGSTILKGANFTVRGKLQVDGSGAQAVPGAVVLLNLVPQGSAGRSGEQADVLGVAQTASDGTFSIHAAASRARNATLPQDAVLFGARRGAGSEVSWSPDTSKLTPDAGYRLTVLAISRQTAPDGRSYAFAATKPGGGSFAARGVLGSSVTSDASNGNFTLPLLTLQSGSQIGVPGASNVTAGQDLQATGLAQDSLGDPLPARYLQGGVLRVTWLNPTPYQSAPEVVVHDGGFDLDLPVDVGTTLGAHNLQVVYDGSNGLVNGASFTGTVQVRYPTNVTGHVTDVNATVTAGEPMHVSGRVVDFHGDAVPAGSPVAGVLQGTSFPGNVSADGAFAIVGTLPTDVGVGTQAVKVKFLGADAYDASEADAGFVTVLQKTVITLPQQTAPLGHDLVVSGKLLDLAGNPVDDPTQEGNTTVRVSTPVLVGFANVTGAEFSLSVPKDLLPGAGPFAVKADFFGSPLYRGSQATSQVLLTSRTQLGIAGGELVRGRAGTILGNLTDERGQGVAGETVNVTFGGALLLVTTGADGRFTADVSVPTDASLGGVVVRASYPGGKEGLLGPATDATAVLQVVAGTTLDVRGRTVSLGALPVNGTLRDDRGQPVPGAKLQLLLENATLGFAVTDLQGSFDTEVPLPEGAVPGTHALVVRYGGSGTLASAEARAPYRILAPSVTSIARAEPLVRSEPGAVLALLAGTDGKPLANRQVQLLIAGTQVGQGVTDTSGQVRLIGRPPGFLAPGNVTVEASFEGDDGYIGSFDTAQVALTVGTRVELTLPDAVDKGQVFTGLILVRDDGGRPLADQPVVVNFTGYDFPLTLRTDAGGQVNFTGRMQGPGQGSVSVRFPGGSGFAPSERGVSIQSRVPLLETGLGALGVALLLVAVIAAAAVLGARRLRRVQVSEAERIIAEAQRMLFASTEYQASILWCFRRLTEHMAEHGFLVKDAFTPRELLEAMARTLPVSRQPLERLVAVFEEARYSPHPIGPLQRDQALQALRDIERQLREARLASKPGQPPATGVTDG
ncbi:MAG: DUF4129 domain-containing protein [Halobacteriales archaeon]|nr:DUF4129 domain-containing protein [Halobacteriales archaeon]